MGSLWCWFKHTQWRLLLDVQVIGGIFVKIYTDDPKVHYIKSTVSPDRIREQIDEVLRAYDTYDIHWHWNPKANDIYVRFVIEEVIDGVHVQVAAKVVCPVLWDKAVRNSPKPERRVERPNLTVSMRAMHWYIKSHLEAAYYLQSSRAAAFLPDLVGRDGGRFFDQIKGRLDQFQALEHHAEPTGREVEVIPPKPRNVTYEREAS
jgi:hypothetical protein